jgi:hypothetical protein
MSEYSKLVFSYNSFLVDFLKLAKKISPEVRQLIKAEHRSINKCDNVYIEFAKEHLDLQGLSSSSPNEGFIINGLSVQSLLSIEDAEVRLPILRLLYVLAAIAQLHKLDKPDDIEKLLNLVVKFQHGEFTLSTQGIFEDDVLNSLILKLKTLCVEEVVTKSQKGLDSAIKSPHEMIMENLHNTKIGSIAKEIAEELDFSHVDMQNPEKWLDIANMTNPNSFLGNIVGKLGSKLTDKMKNGELSQDDLFADATMLMKSMGLGSGLMDALSQKGI